MKITFRPAARSEPVTAALNHHFSKTYGTGTRIIAAKHVF